VFACLCFEDFWVCCVLACLFSCFRVFDFFPELVWVLRFLSFLFFHFGRVVAQS
jgi:hypothetical protein